MQKKKEKKKKKKRKQIISKHTFNKHENAPTLGL
jgi:hypothetical protein